MPHTPIPLRQTQINVGPSPHPPREKFSGSAHVANICNSVNFIHLFAFNHVHNIYSSY